MILGEALLFRSLPLVRYAFVVLAVVHCFVVLYEERALRRKFGESYEAYCRRVPRWWPRADGGRARNSDATSRPAS